MPSSNPEMNSPLCPQSEADPDPDMRPRRPSSKSRIRISSGKKLRPKSPVIMISKPKLLSTRKVGRETSGDKEKLHTPAPGDKEKFKKLPFCSLDFNRTQTEDSQKFQLQKSTSTENITHFKCGSNDVPPFIQNHGSGSFPQALLNSSGSNALPQPEPCNLIHKHNHELAVNNNIGTPYQQQDNPSINSSSTTSTNTTSATGSTTSTDRSKDSLSTDTFVRALANLSGPALSANTLRFNNVATLKKNVTINLEGSNTQTPNYDDMLKQHFSVIGRGTKPITWTTSTLLPDKYPFPTPLSSLDIVSPSFEVPSRSQHAVSPETAGVPNPTLSSTRKFEVVTQQRLSTFCSNPCQISLTEKESERVTARGTHQAHQTSREIKPSFLTDEDKADRHNYLSLEVEKKQNIKCLELCDCDSDSEMEEENNRIVTCVDPAMNRTRLDPEVEHRNPEVEDQDNLTDLLEHYHNNLRQALPDCLLSHRPTTDQISENRETILLNMEERSCGDDLAKQERNRECECSDNDSYRHTDNQDQGGHQPHLDLLGKRFVTSIGFEICA